MYFIFPPFQFWRKRKKKIWYSFHYPPKKEKTIYLFFYILCSMIHCYWKWWKKESKPPPPISCFFFFYCLMQKKKKEKRKWITPFFMIVHDTTFYIPSCPLFQRESRREERKRRKRKSTGPSIPIPTTSLFHLLLLVSRPLSLSPLRPLLLSIFIPSFIISPPLFVAWIKKKNNETRCYLFVCVCVFFSSSSFLLTRQNYNTNFFSLPYFPIFFYFLFILLILLIISHFSLPLSVFSSPLLPLPLSTCIYISLYISMNPLFLYL